MRQNINYIIISFFTLSLFLSVLVQSFILVNYSLNIKSYTDKYCENIEVPEMNCNGTCHLAKQLKINVIETENSTEETVVSIISIFSFLQLNELSAKIWFEKRKLISFFDELDVTKKYISAVFKPPRFS